MATRRMIDQAAPRRDNSQAAYGPPKLPKLDPWLIECRLVGCGREHRAGRVPHGWIRVQAGGSTEPARIYCSGICATKGVARAELRIGPNPKAGES